MITARATLATSAKTAGSTVSRKMSLAWAVTVKGSPVKRCARYAVWAAPVKKWAWKWPSPSRCASSREVHALEKGGRLLLRRELIDEAEGRG